MTKGSAPSSSLSYNMATNRLTGADLDWTDLLGLSQSKGANNETASFTYDSVGRPVKVESGNSTGVKSTVETEYVACACSASGKVYRVSQPYAPGGTKYWTTYTYDALGRTAQVDHPGSSGSTTYLYSANTVKVTDPAGKWKKYWMDKPVT